MQMHTFAGIVNGVHPDTVPKSHRSRSADLRSGAFLNVPTTCRVGDRRSGGSVRMRLIARTPLLFSCLPVTLFHNPSVKHRAGIFLAFLVAGYSALGQMSSNQVATVIAQALTRANHYMVSGMTSNGVVAVVDREGFVLGAWSLAANPSPLDLIDAITKAGTAAF